VERREVIRNAMVFAIAMVMGKFDAVKAAGPAQLRVPLDQWKTVRFEFKGQHINIEAGEIFKALQGMGDSNARTE
jgi:hypothetical protein